MSMKLVEGQFGTGAIPKVTDLRDRTPKVLGMAPIPFDWSVGYDVEDELGYKIKTKNQGQSSSCGGQAMSYYLEVLEALRTRSFEERSARYIYSQVFYPQGGTTMRDIGNIGVRKGDCVETMIPSYNGGNPPSEAFMRNKADITTIVDQNALLTKEYGYAFPKLDIDTVATSIRDNKGMVIKISGQNNGTWLSQFPKVASVPDWEHFLYAFGAKTINGRRYIIIKNSWGDGVGDGGKQYLGEEHFKGMVNDGIVLYDNALYTPNTTVPVTMKNWVQRFLNWFFNSWTKQPLT